MTRIAPAIVPAAIAATAAIAACGGPAAPPENVHAQLPPVPAVRLAAASGHTLKLYRVTRDGLALDRTVETPAPIAQLVWAGSELAVWLDKRPRFSNPCTGDPPSTGHQDEMGRITATGYVAFAATGWPPPDAKPRDPSFDTQFDPPEWELFGRSNGEIWQGRCSWGIVNDGGACEEWTYARRFPEPIVFSQARISDTGGYDLPKLVRPSKDVVAEIVRRPGGDDTDSSDDMRRHVVRCTTGGKSIQYPPEAELDGDFMGMQPIAWIGTVPPIFVAGRGFAGYIGHVEDEIFEGCALSKRFDRALAGPHDMVALDGAKLGVWWRGAQLGDVVDGATLIAFAPGP